MAKRGIKKGQNLGGYARILGLPEDKLEVLNATLLSNRPVQEVVRLMQITWGLYTDVSEDSLRRQLNRYKNAVIVPQQAAIAKDLTADHNVKKLANIATLAEAQFDVVATLEGLVKEQLLRVEKLKKQEGNMPLVLDAQTKNIQLASEMLVKLANIHFDTGRLKKVSTKVDLNIEITEQEREYLEGLQIVGMEDRATARALQLIAEGRHEEIDDADFIEVPRGRLD